MREIKFRAWDKEEKCFISENKLTDQYEHNWLSIINSDSYHFMQYTGLDDKNSNCIYDGDIVRYERFAVGGYTYVNSKVEWRDFGFIVIEPCNVYYSISRLQNVIGLDVEVIGNIYENPELLEK